MLIEKHLLEVQRQPHGLQFHLVPVVVRRVEVLQLLAPRNHQFGVQTPRLVLRRRRRPLPQRVQLLLRALGLELDALVHLLQFVDVLLGLRGNPRSSCASTRGVSWFGGGVTLHTGSRVSLGGRVRVSVPRSRDAGTCALAALFPILHLLDLARVGHPCLGGSAAPPC
ncbi:unnamed protein product [Pelagomonas calceolata]|uniref:Uncharacterized protein n=1 Tax=Pelagomonas calceolata TaxID=35677 RepID=A0A8J2SMU1_9STRA|nr:unnamed protein product [Pelagomonas calceolata]